MSQPPASPLNDFFGHPPGLQPLFMTEMWERMSYYGMRALLVLFMTTAMMEGGLELTVASATAIYGLYTGAVYFMGLPGGWIADRLIGSQRAVWYGGVIIMCGHIVLAIPDQSTFFIGLILVVLGTGLLKPNITALVGQLYGKEDSRRDSGYTIYYMGINIGAFIGYGVTGALAEGVGWHWGFGAAAVGMAIGLIQYRLTQHKLGDCGSAPITPMQPRSVQVSWLVILAFLVVLTLTTAAALTGWLVIDPVSIATYVVAIITSVFFIYFFFLFFFSDLNQDEKKRMWAILLICFASACFWAGFEQAGSSLNLFGRDYTDRLIGSFEIPTTWFQSANSFFILILSPFFAALWVNLGKRMLDPSYAVKSAFGLIIMASGFLVMFAAAHVVASGMKAAPYWLIMTYFLHTVGELLLSPVALSAVSRLSPARLSGQMMGLFVLTYSIGSVIAGLFAGHFDPEKLDQMPGLFMQIALFAIGAGVLVFIIGLKTRAWEKLAVKKPS